MSAGGGSAGPGCGLPPDTKLVSAEDYDVTRGLHSKPEECRKREADIERELETLFEPFELSVAPLAGTWSDGEGDQRLELVLDEKGRGTLLFGEEIELPGFDDPEQPYLLELTPEQWAQAGRSEPNFLKRQGFRYQVVPKNGRASDMTFAIFPSEPWADWCAAQTPVLGLNCYSCELRLDGFLTGPELCYQSSPNISDLEVVESSCERLVLCANACVCTHDSCRAGAHDALLYRVTIDPVDVTVLRFGAEGSMPDRYLVRE
jgi:hypothetical protein